MFKLRKIIQKYFKSLGYALFKLLYGSINGKISQPNNSDFIVEKIILDKSINYKVYRCKNSRLYTNTVHDAAVIIKNKILEGTSYQYRDNNKNSICEENIIFNIGTPRFLKKLNGTVFSLLTGGGGNSNYWHWLYDVLPRLYLLKKIIDFDKIDFFLFPALNKKFQIESLDILKIPKYKRISSLKYRHINSKEIITTDHPYNILNDPFQDSDNIPNWIVNFLKESFLPSRKNNNLPRKFFIDRKDAPAAHNKLRFIINENEVKDILRLHGFEPITLSDLSFMDQVSLFNNAEYIVGLHGAGFSNLAFCKKGTKVLEIRSDHTGDMYKNLAITVGANYDAIVEKGEKIQSIYQLGDIRVNLEKLLNKIS